MAMPVELHLCATCHRIRDTSLPECPCTYRHRCDACGKRLPRALETCPECEQPTRAVVWVVDYLEALAILDPGDADGIYRDLTLLHPLGRAIRVRALEHLTTRLQAHLVGAQRWQGEQAAAAYVKGLGVDLQGAAKALWWCAQRLNAKGDPHGASTASQAHKAVSAKAHEVLS